LELLQLLAIKLPNRRPVGFPLILLLHFSSRLVQAVGTGDGVKVDRLRVLLFLDQNLQVVAYLGWQVLDLVDILAFIVNDALGALRVAGRGRLKCVFMICLLRVVV
jgi:hypothetical protein